MNAKHTNIQERSLELHARHRGKIEVVGKIEIANNDDLAAVYTSGIAAVSEAISNDKSKVWEYTIKANSIAVVSDGSAVLGLGNIGPEAAIPVMEGKAMLFKKFAGIDAFPLCLDTQDTEEIIQTVKHIAPIFGGINLEDISAPRCFEIEERLKNELTIPVMHDDQHGTAVVVLVALINALKVKQANKDTVRVYINGAGAAGTAIAELLLEYGFKNLVVADSKGAIYKGRSDLNVHKMKLADLTNIECHHDSTVALCATGDLARSVKDFDIFIGVSKGDLLTDDMVRSMRANPVIFALANPVPEITPDNALATGAFIVATGRSDFPNQINNVLAFPGIFRGALMNRVRRIEKKMLINAAENLAGCVDYPSSKRIIPDPFEEGVVDAVARTIHE